MEDMIICQGLSVIQAGYTENCLSTAGIPSKLSVPQLPAKDGNVL